MFREVLLLHPAAYLAGNERFGFHATTLECSIAGSAPYPGYEKKGPDGGAKDH